MSDQVTGTGSGMSSAGMSSAGGAHDGPTRLRVIPEANAGYRLTRPAGCQGYKVPVRIFTSPSEYDFPRVGSISLIQIGDARFATLPAEPTTVTGLRIRQDLRNPRRSATL